MPDVGAPKNDRGYDALRAVSGTSPDPNTSPIIKRDDSAIRTILPAPTKQTFAEALINGRDFTYTLENSPYAKTFQDIRLAYLNFQDQVQSYIGQPTPRTRQEIEFGVYWAIGAFGAYYKYKNGVMLPEYYEKFLVVLSRFKRWLEQIEKHAEYAAEAADVGRELSKAKPDARLTQTTDASVEVANVGTRSMNPEPTSLNWRLPGNAEKSDIQPARETSPELEDKDVLNKVDYATVVALKRTYVYYASKGRRDAMDACLKAIEKIRRKPEYRDMYSQKDSSGLAVSGYSYFSNTEAASVYSIHAHIITEENRLAHDETIVNIGGALLGYKLPAPYAALLSAMVINSTTPQGQSPALTDIALAGLALQEGISGKFFTVVGVVVAQNNRSVQVGDIEVVVSMLDRNELGTPQITNSQYLFSNNIELKNEQYWPSVVVPRVR